MKSAVLMLLFLLFGAYAKAQIQVDTNYTILARGITGVSDVSPFLYADLGALVIRENSSGKVCSPAKMQFTFIINSEAFHFTTVAEANNYVTRTKPKDKIIIENIVMPSGCFVPPKQVVLAIR